MQVRLDNTKNTQTNLRRSSQKAGHSSASASLPRVSEHQSFYSIMDEVLPVQEEGNTDLNRLWKELPTVERQLLDHPSQRNLDNYRKAVMQIAKLTLKKNTSVKKIKKRNRNGDWVELTVVEFIDERLQQMVSLMHSEKNTAFTMLKTLDEIRGLLVDIRN